MKKPNNKGGFSTVETLAFILALGGVIAYSYPRVATITKETGEASRAHAVCILEAAKMQFDQDARPDDRNRFDSEGDSERFVMLNQLVTPNTPEGFSSTYKVKKIKINELGKNVEIE